MIKQPTAMNKIASRPGKSTWGFYTLLLLGCALILSGNVSAEKAQWELGIGLTAMEIPLYPGSSQSKTYLFPIPHILYRSENLNIDNGLDATFAKTQKIRFNISADFAVPVNSRDSDARAGMPDLDLIIQLGPSLEITLAGGRFKPSHLKLELPVRAAIATDLSFADNVGWIFEPRLTYETRRPYKTGFTYLISGGLRFSTEDLHQYYYDVPIEFETPDRAQYTSDGGYSGFFTDFIANWRTEDLIFFALLRYQNLSGAAFENSPLVEQKDYVLVGVGASWIFARGL